MKQIESKKENPFSKNNLSEMTVQIDGVGNVTSIPSPFAIIHLFDTAFYIANSNKFGQIKKDCYVNGTGEELYDKLISHCLDIFEMIYYWEELDLAQKGFTVENYSIPDQTQIGGINKKNNHKIFRSTLDLYLNNYRNKLEITSHFDHGYFIKYEGRIIAGTSPLTGFYISAASSFKGIEGKNAGTFYLSNKKDYFRAIGSRDTDFQSFLIALAQQLPDNFINFRTYLTNYQAKSNIAYPNPPVDMTKFGFGVDGTTLDVITNSLITPDTGKTNVGNWVAVPNKFSKIYLRSLLFIEEKVSFNIKKEDYKEKIETRKLLNNQTIPWLSVDDFLEDVLIELEDPINEQRFYCCEVIGINGVREESKVLLPLKEKYFELFDYTSQLGEKLSVRIVKDEKYVVTLKIPIEQGEVSLKKEYIVDEQTDIPYPHGKLIKLDGAHSFYLGIYPFIKDETTPENNGYFRLITYHHREITSHLKFYKVNPKLIEIYNAANEDNLKKCISDYQKLGQEAPCSTFYSLERHRSKGTRLGTAKDVNFDIVQLEISLNKEGKKNEKGKAFILPKFIPVKCEGTSGLLGVDVGTSNTNITIGTHQGNGFDAFEYNSFHTETPTLVMLHKPNAEGHGFNATKEGKDIHKHFLCEFMPHRIGGDGADYRFAVPTILNAHKDTIDGSSVSLVDVNIPFAYANEGMRIASTGEVDKPKFGFKWATHPAEEIYLQLFIDQLLFMSRTMLLSQGQKLDQVKVIWTTPLSMDDGLEKTYTSIWETLYKKYFLCRDAQSTANLKNVDESLSPFFAAKIDFGSGYSITIDVGGGSTDILFYSDRKIQATTSFKFAANALFAGDKNKNIFYDEINRNPATPISGYRRIEERNDSEVYDIINSKFQTDNSFADKLFRKTNSDLMYLLTLHCSAILFHTIQNNQLINEQNGKHPVSKILFSGNGSKLFSMLNNPNRNNLKYLVKYITAYTYGLKLTEVPDPEITFVNDNWTVEGSAVHTGIKAATSLGAISWEVANDSTIDAMEFKVIALGDEKKIFIHKNNTNVGTEKEQYKSNSEKRNELITGTKANVEKFLNGFLGSANGSEGSAFGYSLTNFCERPIDRSVVNNLIKKGGNDLIEQAIRDHLLDYDIPAHSYFFPPIEVLIKKLSEYFKNNKS
jgi:hypothetical protein